MLLGEPPDAACDAAVADRTELRVDHRVPVIGGSRLRTVGTRVLFQVISVPAVTGYNVHWRSSAPQLLAPHAGGVFSVSAIPGQLTPVTIWAEIGRTPAAIAVPTLVLERTVYLTP